MSDTPETDAMCEDNGLSCSCSEKPKELARKLERERDRALLRVKVLKAALPLPMKWRVTVELRVDGLVREERVTYFRTESEAWQESMKMDSFDIPAGSDYEVSTRTTNL